MQTNGNTTASHSNGLATGQLSLSFNPNPNDSAIQPPQLPIADSISEGNTQLVAPSPNLRKRKAPTLRAEDWDRVKARIIELHITQMLPLPGVKDIVERETPGFIATIQQYKTHLSLWNIGKNVKQNEMKAIVRKRQQRTLVETDKKELIFTLRGNVVDPEKIDRWMKRNNIPEDILYVQSPAPATSTCINSERSSPAPSPATPTRSLRSPAFVPADDLNSGIPPRFNELGNRTRSASPDNEVDGHEPYRHRDWKLQAHWDRPVFTVKGLDVDDFARLGVESKRQRRSSFLEEQVAQQKSWLRENPMLPSESEVEDYNTQSDPEARGMGTWFSRHRKQYQSRGESTSMLTESNPDVVTFPPVPSGFKAPKDEPPILESTVGGSSFQRKTNMDSSVDPSYSKRQSTALTSPPPPNKKLKLARTAALTGAETTIRSESRGNRIEPDAIEDNWSIQSSVVILTRDQRYRLITVFTEALLRDIRGRYPLLAENASSIPLHQRCQPLLKEFSEKAKAGTSEKPKQRASRAVRSLRVEISQQCERLFLGEEGEDSSTSRVQPRIIQNANKILPQQKDYQQKIEDWAQRIEGYVELPSVLAAKEGPLDQNASVSSCNTTSVLVASDDEDLSDAIPAGEERMIFNYLTGHNAFSTLVTEFERTIERHYVNTMQLVRERIVLALTRRRESQSPWARHTQAMFLFDLDIPAFLEEQYSSSDQDLSRVITITGRPMNAQLLPLRDYIIQTWEDSPLALLDVVHQALGGSTVVARLSKSSGTISIDLENKTVSVTGSESLIVTVGQQLAWICAACQHSQESLSSAHIRFNELTQRDVSPVGVPQFQIKTELVKVDSNEVKACWCNFLPNSVVAAGFPIRSRSFDETGLEIPMEIMAALGGIVNATEYDGGYVLKGRTIAFVPVGRQADSVQWHFVRSDGSRLHYKDLRTLQRLALADLKEKDLSTTRTFLGWCNSVVNHYGTQSFNYKTVLPPTNLKMISGKVLEHMELTSASIGFSKIVTGTMQFSFGRRDGSYHAQTPNFYQDLLNDARQVPVILQDMEHGRAYYLDGQRFILGVIQHRHSIEPYHVDNKPVSLCSASCDDPNSVLSAMLGNREITLRRDQHLKDDETTDKLYRHEVHDLYECLGKLQEISTDVSTTGLKLKLNWDHSIQGWNYIDLVERQRKMDLREAALDKACGLWPALARDVDAVVLFGDNFDDILQPAAESGMCEAYRAMPPGYDLLAIEVSYIKAMLWRNRTKPDRGILSKGGLQLLYSPDSFKSCRDCTIRTRKRPHCSCKRITELSIASKISRLEFSTVLPTKGAVLIGRGSANASNRPRSIRQPTGRRVLTKKKTATVSVDISSGTSLPRRQRSRLTCIDDTASVNGVSLSGLYSGSSSSQIEVGSDNIDSEANIEDVHNIDVNPQARDHLQVSLLPVDHPTLAMRDTSRSSSTSLTRFTSGRSETHIVISTAPATEDQDDEAIRHWNSPQARRSLQPKIASSEDSSLPYNTSSLNGTVFLTLPESVDKYTCQPSSFCQSGPFGGQIQRTLQRKRPIDFANSTTSGAKRPSLDRS